MCLLGYLIGMALFFLWRAAWPLLVSGFQFATAELAADGPGNLLDVLRRAAGLWLRFARLSIFVYGSYLFWTALPFLAVIALMGSKVSIPGFLLSLLILGFQFYMVARLFVNFLLWQQSAALEGLDGAEALRESAELARSRGDARWRTRPFLSGGSRAPMWVPDVVTGSSGTGSSWGL